VLIIPTGILRAVHFFKNGISRYLYGKKTIILGIIDAVMKTNDPNIVPTVVLTDYNFTMSVAD
jgi:hypothetical protein